MLLERAYKLRGEDDTRAFTQEVLQVIEPFNLGRFGDRALRNRYPVRAEDLFDARCKVGASREEIMAMLDKTGFR